MTSGVTVEQRSAPGAGFEVKTSAIRCRTLMIDGQKSPPMPAWNSKHLRAAFRPDLAPFQSLQRIFARGMRCVAWQHRSATTHV